MTGSPASTGRDAFRVRPASVLDAAAFRDLSGRSSASTDDPAPPLLTTLLDDPVRQRVVVSSDSDGRLAAAAWASTVPGTGNVVPRLTVHGCLLDPAMASTGAGASVLDDLAAWGAGRGCIELTLDLRADDEWAVDAARQAGLEQRGEWVRMGRRLETPAVRAAAVDAPAMEAPMLLDLAAPEPLEPPRWWLHATLTALGMTSMAFTEPWSDDAVRGGLLLLCDAAFVVYLFGFFAWLRYRRQTSRPSGT